MCESGKKPSHEAMTATSGAITTSACHDRHRMKRRDATLLFMSERTQTNQSADTTNMRDAARRTDMSLPAVAAEFSVTDRTIKRWSAADGGWSKLNGPKMTARAQAVADQIQTAVADVASDEDRQTTLALLREDAAVDQRAAVLARHRQEWAGPRALAYEAMKRRDYELARIAKTSSETLRNIQESERKAWGLDPANFDRPSVVVIERS